MFWSGGQSFEFEALEVICGKPFVFDRIISERTKKVVDTINAYKYKNFTFRPINDRRSTWAHNNSEILQIDEGEEK